MSVGLSRSKEVIAAVANAANGLDVIITSEDWATLRQELKRDLGDFQYDITELEKE